MDTKIEEMIYNVTFRPEKEKLLSDIEKALGFKLFVWQKTFILGGGYRRYGATAAECIRELILVEKGPIDCSRAPKSARGGIYREELRRIQERLIQAGVNVRPIFWSEKDKWDYEREKRVSAVVRAQGMWIDDRVGYRCNKCQTCFSSELKYVNGYKLPNFCPECGSDMRGTEEMLEVK